MNDASFSTLIRAGSGDEGALASHTAALDYSTITACTQPTARSLLRLTDYWLSKAPGGALPRRDAIDPTEIIVHLPWLFIADAIGGGADYRYRLVGTSIVSADRGDVTGCSLGELYAADSTLLEGARLGFDRALTTAAPAYFQGRAFWRPDWTYDRFEAVFLPLSSDGTRVSAILGEVAYKLC